MFEVMLVSMGYLGMSHLGIRNESMSWQSHNAEITSILPLLGCRKLMLGETKIQSFY